MLGRPGRLHPQRAIEGAAGDLHLREQHGKEKLRFIVRVVANGVEQNEAWLDSHVVGWYSPTNGPLRHEASDGYRSHRPIYAKSYHEKQAFAIYKLDFDTLHCVSLRTSYPDGVVSAGWTSTPRVRTRKRS